MPSRSRARDEDRRRFIADPRTLAALDLTLDDLGDGDVRSLVIHHEHPEFVEAIEEDREEIEVGGEPVNSRLHLAMHETVAKQLWEDDPQGVWETATRLLRAGCERHEILHMLARPVAEQVWGTLHDQRPYDRDRHVATLRKLPGSWEEERAARPVARRGADARRDAGRAARAARRRNRRRS